MYEPSSTNFRRPLAVSVFTVSERRWIEWIEQIDYCNPFVPERIAAERGVLGTDFDERYADWNCKPELVPLLVPAIQNS